MLGPIDYVIIGFEGNNFDGSIMHELNEAEKKNLIRVVDLMFIMKDPDGNIVEGEYEDQSAALKDDMGDLRQEENEPLLSESDIAKIGELMQPNTAAGVLVIEHLWAKKLKAAIADSGGFLIADGRIHPDLAVTAEAEVTQSSR